jgi:hypothetical protein
VGDRGEQVSGFGLGPGNVSARDIPPEDRISVPVEHVSRGGAGRPAGVQFVRQASEPDQILEIMRKPSLAFHFSSNTQALWIIRDSTQDFKAHSIE